jgi:hypothetical protein
MKSWPPLLETNILNSFRHFLLIVFLYLQKTQINQIKIQINQSSSNLAKKKKLRSTKFERFCQVVLQKSFNFELLE